MKDVDYDYAKDLLKSDFVNDVEVFDNGDWVSLKGVSEVENNKKFDIFDLCFIILSLSILIAVIFYSIYEYKKGIFNIHNNYESECVEFYKKNGYILDSCEKWKNKLENID